MSYTASVAVGLALTGLLDTVLLRTFLLRRRIFWVSYAIVVVFQLVVNGVLTGRGVVRYDPGAIIGLRVAYAPVEDLLFGFCLVAQTLIWWVWLGRRAARSATAPSTAAGRSPQPGAGDGRPAG